MSLTVRATILQTPTRDHLEVLEDHVVTVDGTGVITSVAPASAAATADTTLPTTSVLLPGVIDTHIHAPQWPQLATGLDIALEQWLLDYTFPLEARYADTDFARSVWDRMVPELLSRGTTTAVYYSSIHEPGTTALAEMCVFRGQRAFVGRVAMDHPNGTPEWYRDADANTAIAASHRSIEAIRSLAGAGGLVQPIITPRFIPACTDALLMGLGELAEATGVLVQTHCSENDWQHRYVIDRHDRTDVSSLLRFGLVRDHTVLAHACHLTDDDVDTLVDVGAGVAHCPLSNSYFANAVFPASRYLRRGLRVGLGTDIAGGPGGSVLNECGHAVTSSRMLEDGVDSRLAPDGRGVPGSRIDIVTAFWLATVGGAELLGVPTGLLAVGNAFDAIEVDVGNRGALGIWPEVDDWPRIFEKIVRGASSSDISTVWVNGADVTPRHETSSDRSPGQRTI